jgi:hypothetical protein
MFTEICVFFNDEVGYSIDLQAGMRITYCLGDSTACARLLAMDVLPLSRIPDDLIPTDAVRVDELVEEYHDDICATRSARASG